jgi:hypothetical protein
MESINNSLWAPLTALKRLPGGLAGLALAYHDWLNRHTIGTSFTYTASGNPALGLLSRRYQHQYAQETSLSLSVAKRLHI